MAVYYKFKSAKDFDSVSIEGHFITVGNLKEKIFESKQLGRGKDYDLVVINAQTNEEYLDAATLIPKNTSVLIRRLAGLPHMPIVTTPVSNQEEQVAENRRGNVPKTTFLGAEQSVTNHADDLEDDEFGNDLYEIPEVAPVISSNPVPPPSKADDENKNQALISTPALEWQQTFDGFGGRRGIGHGMGGRGFGRGGFDRQTPPDGYVCHRCKTPGHYIQHCPTNGDPNFDIKRVKPPTGIPRSMLMATPDALYALPSEAVAVLKPNVATFEKEIEGMPTTHNVSELPPELQCPLCKEVMKDAVLTSKCCFRSFCDKCIRDQIILKAKCVCGATGILADDLLPNRTVRDTIRRILKANNCSADNPIQGKEFAPSAASKGGQAPSQNVEATNMQGSAEQEESPMVQRKVLEKGKIRKVPDVSETTHDSRGMKEPTLQGSAQPAEKEVRHKQVPVEAAKKKKKKKVNLPPNAAEMQWTTPRHFAAESYMPPPGPFPYNPYWNSMQPGMEAYMGPYGGAMPPFMGYGAGPLNVPFGVPGLMPPLIPPHRNLAELGMRVNDGPPIISREEFEAWKAELRQKRGLERGDQRELPKDQESRMEVSSSVDVSSMKLKSVRTFVVHVLFIPSIFCITTGNSLHPGNLLAKYIVGWAINELKNHVLRMSSIHDSKKNNLLVTPVSVEPFCFFFLIYLCRGHQLINHFNLFGERSFSTFIFIFRILLFDLKLQLLRQVSVQCAICACARVKVLGRVGTGVARADSFFM